MLTNRLKRLCDEGLLERVPDPERPGRPKYVLTDKGRELAPALIVLMKWGDRHYPTPGGPPRLTLHAGCGGNVGSDLRCDRCGKQATPGEIELPPGPGAPRGDGNLGPDLRCDRCGKQAARGEIELPPGPGAPRGEHAEGQASAARARSGNLQSSP